ncbi:MAG: hypothetical protein NTY04_04175 [Candidatus Staskawiczbacteria bacterium]|nr:hypothetical protein [Candidatus Staskawiczbacteria bacterium]
MNANKLLAGMVALLAFFVVYGPQAKPKHLDKQEKLMTLQYAVVRRTALGLVDLAY